MRSGFFFAKSAVFAVASVVGVAAAAPEVSPRAARPVAREVVVVRDVAVFASSSATVVAIDFQGSLEPRQHWREEGGFVLVELEGATLEPSVPRLVPVADRRVDGVVVQEDAAAATVLVTIDLARRQKTIVQEGDGARLLLRFGDDPSLARDATPAARRQPPRESPPPAAEHRRREAPPPGRPALEAGSGLPPRETGQGRGGGASAARPPVAERAIVVLDPGHGGKDPGARAWTGEYEKDIVLDLAERVARRLRSQGGIDVVLTRSSDEYVTLGDRRAVSGRWRADAFVSIHANASGNSAARGIETYYYRAGDGDGEVDRGVRRLARAENSERVSRAEKSAQAGLARTSARAGVASRSGLRERSRVLATRVQEELVQRLGMRYEAVRDLGAKEGPFFVLDDNAAPSVLVEAAFLTHREEGVRMGSEVYREQIADGIARGVLAFLEERRRGDPL